MFARCREKFPYLARRSEGDPNSDLPEIQSSCSARSRLRFFGSISAEEAREMSEVIELACGRVSSIEW